MLPPIKSWWPPRDWRSMIALVGSIGGGAVAFILTWRAMTFLSGYSEWREGLTLTQQLRVVLAQLSSLRMIAGGSLILMGISMVGLWFVLGKRTIELSAGKFRASAGGGHEEDDDEPPVIARTTTVTETVAPNSSSTTTEGSKESGGFKE